jgi:hypothetical protein
MVCEALMSSVTVGAVRRLFVALRLHQLQILISQVKKLCFDSALLAVGATIATFGVRDLRRHLWILYTSSPYSEYNYILGAYMLNDIRTCHASVCSSL